MYSKSSFRELIVSEIKKNLGNNYSDNWDYPLFGEFQEKKTARSRAKVALATVLPGSTYSRLVTNHALDKHLEGLTYMYNNLENNSSKELLVKILAYRVMGHKKVRLPLSNEDYWQGLKKAESLRVESEKVIDPHFMNFTLAKHDLKPIGYPIKFYFTPTGILTGYIIKQYVYDEEGTVIKADEGDVVIDAGGCWGDTALFFGNAVGDSGKVYCFEFVPGNLEIMKTNFDLNPEIAKRITIAGRPLWSKSGIEVFFDNNGPGSRVSMEKFQGYTHKSSTISIDDFVRENNPERIDFIKMDIEGAETFSLDGAMETIKTFKPKLAISVYHSLPDFYNILRMIKDLNLGYKFFLRHATIHSQETVLFATVK